MRSRESRCVHRRHRVQGFVQDRTRIWGRSLIGISSERLTFRRMANGVEMSLYLGAAFGLTSGVDTFSFTAILREQPRYGDRT